MPCSVAGWDGTPSRSRVERLVAGREENRGRYRCVAMSRRARPAEERERLLEAVAAGAPLTTTSIPASTVRSWRRRDPEFARRYAGAQAAAATRTPSTPLELGEWERLLARACRRGSVAALRLWRETHPVTAAAPEHDELARLRELHARVEAHR
jgi:hypothetical protein